ncbi:MAG: D-sedoheptulose 7-phosphate isomerase [Candidatus Tectomicrobia bacterium]|uniref:Phosphoheptose isomerase n=1 Tax=Tectimicrobiota bacterium TaxID=2528274 RepID=A0A933GM47_UNCTE|nr:D-sedoheptulose 7-phosphate isomerase [Candidatus Tectomicrobia bacterium]
MRFIESALRESARIKEKVAETLTREIEAATELIIKSLENGGRLLIMGNGGSAADAQHLAAELVGRFHREREGIPALALTTDTSILTALGNDYGFEKVFSRQVEAHGRTGDILLGLSTSGRSPNIARAFEKASEMGLKTIGLLGCGGGDIKDLVDLAIVIPSSETPRIQEAHITVGHIICQGIEDAVVEKTKLL